MKSFSELRDSFKKKPADCTGIDIGATVTKAVRLKKSGDGITVVGAALIHPETDGTLTIPPQLRARQASISMSSPNTVIKLLTFPGPVDDNFEKNLPQKLGITTEEKYRQAYRVINEGSSRTESSVLAAAVPEEDAAAIMRHFTSGIPAPYSLEISALASLNAFEHSVVNQTTNDTATLIDFGTYTTSLAVFYRRKPVLFQYFDFGTKVVTEKIKTEFKVNTATALGILEDTSFDLSDLLSNLMGSVAGHMVISRDFIERQKNCSIDTVHAIGGITRSQAAMKSLSKLMSVKIILWDPFENLKIDSSQLSQQVDSQHWRFAGAIGAALATLEEE